MGIMDTLSNVGSKAVSFVGGTVEHGVSYGLKGLWKGFAWGSFLGAGAGVGLAAIGAGIAALVLGTAFTLAAPVAVMAGLLGAVGGAIVGTPLGGKIGAAIGIITGGVKRVNKDGENKTVAMQKELIDAQMGYQQAVQNKQAALANLQFNNEAARTDFAATELAKRQAALEAPVAGMAKA